MTLSFSATAVAVALIVVAVTLFGSRGRAPTRTAHAGASATQTASAQRAASAASLGPIVAISMISPNDGWALGDATPQSANGEVESIAALYHYDGATWTLKQRVKGFAAIGAASTSLKMFSATNGWAFNGSLNTLRYDGTTWRMTSIVLPDNEQVRTLFSLDIVSPTEGWAIAYVGPSTGGSEIAFLRFDGRQWIIEQKGFTLPNNLDASSVQFMGISAAPEGNPWAVGTANIKGVTPDPMSNPPQASFMLHRVNGEWRLENQLPLPSGASSMLFNSILMTGPSSGWAAGRINVNKPSIAGGTLAVEQPLLMRYDGSRWAPVPIPNDLTANGYTLTQITASAPNNIWVVVEMNGSIIDANGVTISAMFLHYNGETWNETPVSFSNMSKTTIPSISALYLASDGTLWALGSLQKLQANQVLFSPFICSFRNGVWSIATITTK